LKVITLIFLLLISWQGAIAQSTPLAGDILFTHADADGEVFEFITLKRLNLINLKFTDNGVCSNNYYRTTEQTFVITSTALNDIPCGTLVRIRWNSSGIDDTTFSDGIILLHTSNGTFINPGGTPALANSGEQIISFLGTQSGSLSNCGVSGTINYISGIDWGKTSGWVPTGASSSNNSKAPGTITDFENKTNSNNVYFNNIVSGNVSAIIAASGNGVRNPNNWNDTGSAGTFLPLKNIQFHSSNYLSGIATATSGGGTSSTLNLSGLSFSNTNSDTRYLVVLHANASPSTPANRFTCYTPNNNYSLSDSVVTAVSSPPCNGPSKGNGKVVYFNYNLPNNLIITGLSNNTCYQVRVYAINGNGYSANYSSTPASLNFYTGNLVSSLIAY
jgi:hypothetical protein